MASAYRVAFAFKLLVFLIPPCIALLSGEFSVIPGSVDCHGGCESDSAGLLQVPRIAFSHAPDRRHNIEGERAYGLYALAKAVDAEPLKLLAPLIAFAVFCSVFMILWHRGLQPCFVACLFIVCLVLIALMMHELGKQYAYPGFVTFLHYCTMWFVSAAYFTAAGEPQKLFPSSLGSTKRFVHTVIPIALFLPVSVALNNTALVYLGAGLCMVIGLLSPFCTAILKCVLGQPMTSRAWLGLTIALAGALIIAGDEVKGAATQATSARAISGMTFAFGALLLRSGRIVLQESLVAPPVAAQKGSELDKQGSSGETGIAISALHLNAVQSPPVVFVSLLYAQATEGVVAATNAMTMQALPMVLATCVVASGLNIFGAKLLKMLGAVEMQLVGKLNTIVTMSLSMAYFGEAMQSGVLLGSVVLLLGIAVFEDWGGKP